MGKKVFFAAFLLLGFFAPQAWAYDFTDTASSGQTLQYTILADSTSVSVAKHGTMTGDLVIPSTVTNDGTTYTVTTIKANGFGMCFGLTSVSIPNSVTTIGGAAFHSCIGLTSITIPDSVTTIGDNAFMLCTGLLSVTIGNSVGSIGTAAFSSCDGLTTVTLPGSVTYIGAGAFYCRSLDTITVLGQTPPTAHAAAFGAPTARLPIRPVWQKASAR